MIADFRFAVRTLFKAPGFCLIAILTLGLAIGVNSAVFTLINSIVLRPVVPLRPAEVVNIFTAKQGANQDYRQFSHAEYLALRANKDVFADVAAVNFVLAGIGRDEGIRRSFAFFASENFFGMMGVAPAAGRFFTVEESRPNAAQPVIVASYTLWQRMGGKPDFVGSSVWVNGQAFTVVGVAPEGFSGLHALIAPEIWLPLGIFAQFAKPFSDSANVLDLASPTNYTLNLTARMQRGLTVESARPRLAALAQQLQAIQPAVGGTNPGRDLQIQTPSRFSLGTEPSTGDPVAVLSVTLLGMAGCVLLIASLNLANMMLARGTARTKEIAVRLALGASRGRVIRQLLAEGLVLSLLGGAAGLLLSVWANDLLLQSLSALFRSMNFSLVVQSKPDLLVVAVTLLFCVGATLLFSLGPALKASRVDLVNDLKQQVGEHAAAGKLNRFFAPRHCLVMAQIALSLMLLFSAGLFFRGALRAGGLDLGFRAAGNLVAELDFSLANTPETDARAAAFAAIERARQQPGVAAAAVATLLPYGALYNAARVVPASLSPNAAPEEVQKLAVNPLFTATSPGYFETLGVARLRGRDFSELEARDKGAPRVAIVDELLAQKLFPNADAIGQHIRYTQAPMDGSPAEMEIVGIVKPHRHGVFNRELVPRLYVPLAQGYSANLYLHVQLDNENPAATAAAIAPLRTALRAGNGNLPLLRITPYTLLIDQNIGLWIVRLGAGLFGVFGGIALVLAIVGVYGVKAYAVARRTREIGIRMALGAHPHDVFALIMKQGALQTLVALVAGVALALGAGQLLTKMLYQVSPRDPLALGFAAALLAVAALAACFLPARRATRVSPTTALRTE